MSYIIINFLIVDITTRNIYFFKKKLIININFVTIYIIYFYLSQILFSIVTKIKKCNNIYIKKLYIINNYYEYVIKLDFYNKNIINIKFIKYLYLNSYLFLLICYY